jgi:hypothetical protein
MKLLTSRYKYDWHERTGRDSRAGGAAPRRGNCAGRLSVTPIQPRNSTAIVIAVVIARGATTFPRRSVGISC